MISLKIRNRWWIAVAYPLTACLEVSAASAQIKRAPDGHVIAISNLVSRDECFPAKVKGRIVKRDFDNRGLYLLTVIVEEKYGSRTFVNIDSSYASKDSATVGNIKNSLETLLAIGKKVEMGVYGCGAAGRVLKAHSIKSI